VLVSGDGDFVPLVHALNARGCRTEVVSFEQCTSNDLMRDCHQFISIEPEVLFKEEKFVRQAAERRYEDRESRQSIMSHSPGHYSNDD
jgi:uncharacterized LabA/DUF88 family protein